MKLINKNIQGDTIVEVMISMLVLSIVIAATYSLANHSFQSGLNSQYRDQAASYAQQELEIIKDADNSHPSDISKYKPPTVSGNFCINPSTKDVETTASQCGSLFGQYSINITYNDSSDIYKVTAGWQAADGTDQQTAVYYKPNDSFAGPITACTAESPTCQAVDTNVPAVGIRVTPPGDPIRIGTPVTLDWSITNVVAGSCDTSSSPAVAAFDGLDPNTIFTFSSSSLPTGANNFTITCRDNANNPVTGSAVVTISNPMPTTTLSASPHQLGLQFSSAGAIPGKTCRSVNESADPDTWSDNYLCWPTSENLGLSWSTAGPISGQTCLRIFEGSDPYTWWDNYLCSPRDYGLRWSSGGPIAGMSCGTQWYEGADPNTWNDNYLCEPTNSAVDLSWTSTDATSCSSSWGGGGTGTTGSDIQFGLTANPTNYSVTCTGGGGSKTANQPVAVGGIASQPACAGFFCSAPSNGVVFCDGTNYNAPCYGPFPNDCRWVESCGVPNDTISSVFFAGGYSRSVRLFKDIDFGYPCSTINSSQPSLGSWDNIISAWATGGSC